MRYEENLIAECEDHSIRTKEECVQQTAAVSKVNTSGRRSSVAEAQINANNNGTGKAQGAKCPILPRLKLLKSETTGAGLIEVNQGTNPLAVPIASKFVESLIYDHLVASNQYPSRQAINDVKSYLQSNAERNGTISDIWYRVAPVPGGVEFDLGDKTHARARVTATKVEIIASGSLTVFCRTAAMLPMPMPAQVGDVDLLKKYVNLNPVDYLLWLAWVTFTLSTPKQSSAAYVVLVLRSGEGCGKTMLAKLTLRVTDPNQVGMRRFPKNDKDFAVAAQSAHVLAFDNVRSINPDESDRLCMAATGGCVTNRALYTDSEESVMSLHVAVILTGIVHFVDQPDLAQRTLTLQMKNLPEHLRRSEDAIEAELRHDLPAIQRGLFDLISKIFGQLPKVNLTSPSRMINFSRWLAALELVHGAPNGIYQDVYLDALCQTQLDCLLNSPLAAGILSFAERLPDGKKWVGMPSQLLAVLNQHVEFGNRGSKDWPTNAVALSKRLSPLQTALRSQGVAVELSRSKTRTVTISWIDGYPKDRRPAVESIDRHATF